MNDSEETHHTYDEWNRIGMKIHAGEKASFFREGEPYFGPEQVYKPTPQNFTSNHLGSFGPWSDHGPKG